MDSSSAQERQVPPIRSRTLSSRASCAVPRPAWQELFQYATLRGGARSALGRERVPERSRLRSAPRFAPGGSVYFEHAGKMSSPDRKGHARNRVGTPRGGRGARASKQLCNTPAICRKSLAPAGARRRRVRRALSRCAQPAAGSNRAARATRAARRGSGLSLDHQRGYNGAQNATPSSAQPTFIASRIRGLTVKRWLESLSLPRMLYER